MDAVVLSRFGDGTAATARVNIRDGVAGFDGLSGSILGTSDLLNLAAIAAGVLETMHFDFASTSALTVGNAHVIELEIASGILDIEFNLLPLRRRRSSANGFRSWAVRKQ